MKWFLRSGEPNLRGREAIVIVDWKPCRVKVITHIRNDRWLVEGRELPKRYRRPFSVYGVRRMTVAREDLMLVNP